VYSMAATIPRYIRWLTPTSACCTAPLHWLRLRASLLHIVLHYAFICLLVCCYSKFLFQVC
jgi:hypothetical protein